MSQSIAFNVTDFLIGKHITYNSNSKIAIVGDSQEITYQQLAICIANFSVYLDNLKKVNKGDTVVCLFDDSVESAICFLGLIYGGYIPCYLNPGLPTHNIGFYLESVNSKLVLISDKYLKVFQSQFEKSNTSFQEIKSHSLIDTTGTPTFDSYKVTKESPLFYSFTSGTTGYPSSVMHRHKDIVIMNENYVATVLNVTSRDTLFTTSKMFFGYGLNNLFIALYYGATARLSSQNLSPESIYDIFNIQQPSVFFSVPSIYNHLINYNKLYENQFIPKLCVSAGETLPARILNEWDKRFNTPIIDGIGSTETLSTFISNTPEDVKPNCTGRLVSGFQAVVKDDNGNKKKNGETGNLWIKGGTYHISYLNNEKATNERFSDGWFITNDLFYQDDDGYFYYQGRLSDLIYRKGIWLFPERIEARINQHDDIIESAVIGLRDAELNTLLLVFIVSNNYSSSLEEEICALNKKSTYYKEEEMIDLMYLLDALPKTFTGKIKRHELKQLALEEKNK